MGKPIDQPKMASAEVVADPAYYDSVKEKMHYTINGQLENITEMTNKIVFGKVSVF